MSMGERSHERQPGLFVASAELARSPRHPFYDRLNELLLENGFDASKTGRPSMPPGIETPTRAEKPKIDKKRKKKGSNKDWKHPGDLVAMEFRTYISEPDGGRRRWKNKSEERDAVYANRRRIRGDQGQRLRKLRGEITERRFADCLETGGGRRAHVRRRDKVAKRALVGGATYNLGLLLWALTGIGTPKGLQGCFAAGLERLCGRLIGIRRPMNSITSSRSLVAENLGWIFMRAGNYEAA
jgi:hypothetical protein